jgi:adenine/guanine phosphoribosyltransferase-like PRPP-binding protein
VGVRVDEFNPDEYEAWVKHSKIAYSEKCWSFCDLATRCQLIALREDRGIVLGTEVARALGGVSMARALELLNGAESDDST